MEFLSDNKLICGNCVLFQYLFVLVFEVSFLVALVFAEEDVVG